MDFPYKQLTPKGQVKVNEGQMDSLFDLEKYEDFNEDNIMRDILCLSTIGTDFDFRSCFFFCQNFEISKKFSMMTQIIFRIRFLEIGFTLT